jgi:hypothetical protein
MTSSYHAERLFVPEYVLPKGGMDYQNNDVVETEHRNKLAISEEIS